MDFPRYVFTSEGEEKCSEGTYGLAIVEDKDEFDASIKAGYKKDITDLFKKSKSKAGTFKKPKTKTFKEIEKKEEKDLVFDIRYLEEYTKPQIMLFLDREEKEYGKEESKETLSALLKQIKDDDF